jgi:hypothetical protein
MKHSLCILLLSACCAFPQGIAWLATATKPAAAAAATPAWGGEISSRLTESSDASTSTLTATRTCAVGETIIIFGYRLSATDGISGITDQAGNAYGLVTNLVTSNNDRMSYWTNRVSSQLSSGQTITITWQNPTYAYRGAIAGYATGLANPAVDGMSGGAMTYGTSCSQATIANNASPALILSWYIADGTAVTHSENSFAAIGSGQQFGASGSRSYFFQTNVTSTATWVSGGTWGTSCSGNYVNLSLK